MKRRLSLVAALGLLLSGCAVHSQRIQGDEIILMLRQPSAKTVVLACSLDGFTLRPAQMVSGRWEVKLPANSAFRYFYKVDGRIFIPDCSMKESDDFGSENCIFDPGL